MSYYVCSKETRGALKEALVHVELFAALILHLQTMSNFLLAIAIR